MDTANYMCRTLSASLWMITFIVMAGANKGQGKPCFVILFEHLNTLLHLLR